MHGFRDNKVKLPTGNDIIVISPLSHRFCWRNLQKRLQFHNNGSLTYSTYLLPFRSYSKFYFGWQLPMPTHVRGVLGVKHLHISKLHTSHHKKVLPYTRPRLLSYCARKLALGYGLQLCWRITKKTLKSHRTRICYHHVASRPLIGSEPNVAGLVNSLT